jgi:hypothetical protein
MLTHTNLSHIYGKEGVKRTVFFNVMVYMAIFEVLTMVLMKIQVF